MALNVCTVRDTCFRFTISAVRSKLELSLAFDQPVGRYPKAANEIVQGAWPFYCQPTETVQGWYLRCQSTICQVQPPRVEGLHYLTSVPSVPEDGITRAPQLVLGLSLVPLSMRCPGASGCNANAAVWRAHLHGEQMGPAVVVL